MRVPRRIFMRSVESMPQRRRRMILGPPTTVERYFFVFLLHKFRSVPSLQGPRKSSGFRLSEELESIRGSCVWVQSGGARTSKVSEVSAVSEVLESLKRARFARASKVSGRKLCPVASLAGKQVMPCSAFAGHETWYARVHCLARPHYSRLSEMSSFTS